MSETKRKLEETRAEMGRIDGELLAALERRGRLARSLRELGVAGESAPVETETAPLSSLISRSSGALPAEDLRLIFDHVRAACASLERPIVASYSGAAGSHAHSAARARFGAAAELLAPGSAAQALDEVTRKRAECALLPLEVLGEGPVQSTISAVLATELRFRAIVEHTHDLHVLSASGNFADTATIYVAAADRLRASRFLSSPGLRVIEVASPLAACTAARDDTNAGAVAGDVLGAERGLVVARRSVTDSGPQRVRYAEVSTRSAPRSGNDATACVFGASDTPGALLSVLASFAEREINLTRIHSFPVGASGDQDWAYLFFLELGGHGTDRSLVSALEDVKRKARFFKLLGSYPAAG